MSVAGELSNDRAESEEPVTCYRIMATADAARHSTVGAVTLGPDRLNASRRVRCVAYRSGRDEAPNLCRSRSGGLELSPEPITRRRRDGWR
jgi:hypothetical protein